MEFPLKILLLEDNYNDAELLKLQLSKSDFKFQIIHVDTKEKFIDYLTKDTILFDVILSDYSLFGFTGIDALEIAKKNCPLIPFIIVTGTLDEETAAETIKAGAWDYVVKERMARLIPAIKNALKLKIEKELIKKQNLQLRTLSRAVNHAPALIVITDVNGNIEYVNPKYTKVTGYSFEEVKGKNPRIIQSGNHSQSFYKNLWDTILAGKEWNSEIVNKKKNGELYWESASISPVKNDENEITHFVAIKEDITEKKKIEFELIKAKEKAEESDKLKSSFLANMSHEIRTPMNGIIGFTNLLSNKNLSKGNVQHYKNIIEKSSNQLLSIINDIIDISKIESGQSEIHISLVNIFNVVKDNVAFFEKTAADKKIPLIINVKDSDTKTSIKTDETKVKQVLMNLLSNALKFTKSGSIEIGYKTEEKEILLYVKDTGIGIKKEMHEKIFDRFRQADVSATRQHGGTGLGLSISKAFIEMLGGKIWIESNIGKGTIFYFTLPFKEKIKEDNPFDSKVQKNFEYNWSDKTILIVEDDLLIVEFFKEVLKNTKAKTIFAYNGQEVLNIMKTNSEIDFILLDIKMPVMNGYDVIKHIRPKNPDLPIIAQTAFAFSDEKKKILEAGFNDYISKPIDKDKLLHLINSYIKK